jgi:hypothetical protein
MKLWTDASGLRDFLLANGSNKVQIGFENVVLTGNCLRGDKECMLELELSKVDMEVQEVAQNECSGKRGSLDVQ